MSAYLSLIGRRGGGRLFEAGRLFEVGANPRLDAYSNEYGNKCRSMQVRRQRTDYFFCIFSWRKDVGPWLTSLTATLKKEFKMINWQKGSIVSQ